MPSYQVINVDVEDGFRLLAGDDLNRIVQTVNTNALNLRVHTSSTDVTIFYNDHTIVVNKIVGGPTNVYLPNIGPTRNPTLPLNLYPGRRFQVKDGKGDAASNNILLVPPPGINIDGQPTFNMIFPYESVDILFNGTEFNIL